MMSQDVRESELHGETQRLLQGPLKHVRAAALAAALVPLASVAVAPAAAQTSCPTSAGVGIAGFVWFDANGNGLQDPGEAGIGGAVVSLSDGSLTSTDPDGIYVFEPVPGDYAVLVQIPPGTQATLANVGPDDAVDSDGVSDGFGNSVAPVTVVDGGCEVNTDFGFSTPTVAQPGTGTPGYWKNHPEAWPVASLSIGGTTYTKAQILSWLDGGGKDKTLTMMSSLASAMLNLLVGNDSSCVATTIDGANAWMATYGPAGSKVAASSFAWKQGEPLHRQMDNYNNGMLCAPHRD